MMIPRQGTAGTITKRGTGYGEGVNIHWKEKDITSSLDVKESEDEIG